MVRKKLRREEKDIMNLFQLIKKPIKKQRIKE